MFLAMWIRSPIPSSTTFSFLVLLLVTLWTHACPGEELPKEVVLDWFRQRVLDGLGLEEAPVPSAPERGKAGPEAGQVHQRSTRVGRAAWAEHQRSLNQDQSQVILFPSPDSTCSNSTSPSEDATSHFTYYFQPSLDNQASMVTSAHLWFYAGEAATGYNNSSSSFSAPLFILTSDQKLQRAAEGPSKTDTDGWTTYHLEHHLHTALGEGPFILQVRCPACDCSNIDEPDKMPFLHLHARPRGPERSPRRAATFTHLQRPSQERPEPNDCHRVEINISFEELGWDNWIVHPKDMTFYYCHGNCSASDRTTTRVGIPQCCTPVLETMMPLRITTTSDGGYSYKYETLPKIMAEGCICM